MAAEKTDRLKRELQEARGHIEQLSDGQQLAQAREGEHAELLVRFNSLQVSCRLRLCRLLVQRT